MSEDRKSPEHSVPTEDELSEEELDEGVVGGTVSSYQDGEDTILPLRTAKFQDGEDIILRKKPSG